MSAVLLHDVGLRDGLQIEERTVPTARKLAWIEQLVVSGVDLVQVGSFVNPQKVPQMADTDSLFHELETRGLKERGATFTALVLNEKGLERGMACGVDSFCMGVSASDTHSRKNTGMSTEEATGRIVSMGRQALASGKELQVSVQSAFGCGYEGRIPQDRVLALVDRFLEAGFTTVSLADTAGHADPSQVEELFGAIRERAPNVRLACHFHDTYGLGLANAASALRAGVTSFESAFGGLGGCPFTAVASGNVCTEDLVHMLHRMNLRRDIDLEPLIALSRDAASFFERPLPGTIYRTGAIPHPGRFAARAVQHDRSVKP